MDEEPEQVIFRLDAGWPSPFAPGGRSTPFVGGQQSKPLAIELESGQSAEIKLSAGF
jgi:hypothetical protein